MTSGQEESPGRSAARHARLSFRVGAILEQLDKNFVVVPDVEANKLIPPDQVTPSAFVVQFLELRIRLILLVDAQGPADLQAQSALRSAKTVLDHWPETAAVGLVANDDELSCLVVEPEDVSPSVGVPSGVQLTPRARLDTLPLDSSIRRYIESSVPSWELFPPETEVSIDFASTADIAARDAIAAVRGKSALIPLRVAAHRELSSDDEQWAADLIRSVLAKNLGADEIEESLSVRAGVTHD